MPGSWRLTAVFGSEMACVRAHLKRFKLPIDFTCCATSWMRSINHDASDARPAVPLSATAFVPASRYA